MCKTQKIEDKIQYNMDEKGRRQILKIKILGYY